MPLNEPVAVLGEQMTPILQVAPGATEEEVEQVVLPQPFEERAAQPMPTELGTPDAIHLATALLWRESEDAELVMATHDRALAVAAEAHGLIAIGV